MICNFRFFPVIFIILAMCSWSMHEALAQEDASARFLNAYTDFQTAERLERDNDPAAALEKYRRAAAILDQIAQDDPSWQPMVVKYRLRKINEAIQRLDASGVEALDLGTGDFPEGALPTRDNSGSSGSTARRTPSVSGSSSAQAELERLKNENQQLRTQLNLFQREVDKTRVTVVELRHELAVARSSLAEALDKGTATPKETKAANEKIAKLEEELNGIKAERENLTQENKDLLSKLEEANTRAKTGDEARENLKVVTEERDALKTDQDKLNKDLKDALAELEASRKQLGEVEKLTENNKSLQEKLDKNASDLATAQAELEEAKKQIQDAQESIEDSEIVKNLQRQVAELEAQKEAISQQCRQEVAEMQSEVEALHRGKTELTAEVDETKKSADALAEHNKELEQKLTESAEKLATLQSEGVSEANSEKVSSLQSELNSVNDRLLGMRMEITARDARIAELEGQLDSTAGDLAKLKLNSEEADTQTMVTENELLRGIIMRQLKEQARRDQAKRLIEEEIAKLEVKSETLSKQLNTLTAPFEMSDEEKALFRTPMSVATGDEAGLDLGLAVTKPADGENPQDAAPADEEKKETPSTTGEAGLKALPEPMRNLAMEGQAAFDRGDLASAEHYYQTIVDAVSDNQYALSRLAVVQFEAGKFQAAEVALDKALSMDKDDAFSHAILGVVYYRQGKKQEAKAEIEEAIRLDPETPKNYNYLGIVCGDLGDAKGAEKALQKAIEIEPRYAEGHFNLAVVYATQTPPALSLAKTHYAKAVQLGAAPDRALERMLSERKNTDTAPGQAAPPEDVSSESSNPEKANSEAIQSIDIEENTDLASPTEAANPTEDTATTPTSDEPAPVEATNAKEN
ncbi:MAG: tetratricopeptide repeat protein [Chthoniobacterales bacterium]